jgi:hypothetical protein
MGGFPSQLPPPPSIPSFPPSHLTPHTPLSPLSFSFPPAGVRLGSLSLSGGPSSSAADRASGAASTSRRAAGGKGGIGAGGGGIGGGAGGGGDGDEGSAADSGAVVRLHSALIAVLTHLVGKLRAVAVRDVQIAGVVFPLLDFSTSLGERGGKREGGKREGGERKALIEDRCAGEREALSDAITSLLLSLSLTPFVPPLSLLLSAGSQESECLVEEAFRLWNTTISSLPEVPPQLLALLPHLGALLTRGKVREGG